VLRIDDEDIPVLDLDLLIGEGDDSLDKVEVGLLGRTEDDHLPSLGRAPKEVVADHFGEEVLSVVEVGEHRVPADLMRPDQEKIKDEKDKDGQGGRLDDLEKKFDNCSGKIREHGCIIE